MKLALVGIRGAARIICDFVWPQFAGVPTPGQAQMPSSAVRAKERTEGTELKPADMQLAGVVLCRNKAADVGAPVRYSCQPSINCHRHVSLQGLPGRVNIARPKKRSVTLHAGLTVSMECERSFVWTQLPRTFVIHSMARQPRWSVQAVSLIRPPTINAHIVKLLVNGPVTTDLSIVGPMSIRRSPARQRYSRARLVHGSG